MGYYLEYSPELKKRYPQKVKQTREPVRTVAIVLLAAVAAYVSVRGGLIRYILPGDYEVTTAALSQLIEQVVSGEPISQSVVTFCEEIIINGK